MNEKYSYFYNIAKLASTTAWNKKGLYNIDGRWLFCQFLHESEHFTSELAINYYNIGGLSQTEENDAPQPDGNGYYMKFNSYEDYADYFGRYLGYYVENGIDNATTLEEYIVALHDGGYFGDSLENYLSDCQDLYNEYFGGVE